MACISKTFARRDPANTPLFHLIETGVKIHISPDVRKKWMPDMNTPDGELVQLTPTLIFAVGKIEVPLQEAARVLYSIRSKPAKSKEKKAGASSAEEPAAKRGKPSDVDDAKRSKPFGADEDDDDEPPARTEVDPDRTKDIEKRFVSANAGGAYFTFDGTKLYTDLVIDGKTTVFTLCMPDEI
jgi:hypothetical protein